MCQQNENAKLIETSAAKRSIVLTLMGVPMIFVAWLGTQNIVCAILAIVYVFSLLVNGIVSFPIIVKEIYRVNKKK